MLADGTHRSVLLLKIEIAGCNRSKSLFLISTVQLLRSTGGDLNYYSIIPYFYISNWTENGNGSVCT